MKAADVLLDLLCPSRCIVCRRYMGPEPPGVCRRCLSEMPPPPRGGKRVEFGGRAAGVFSYTGPFRDAVLRYKFGARDVYAKPFGKLLAAKIAEEPEGRYDLITWLPIHWKRRLRRGYDQAKLLAKHAARNLGTRPVRTLRKIRNTKPQSQTSSPAERRANILNAFRAVRPERFRGKRILLIDDILTTGATMNEAARTLLTAGADEVVCCVLAMTTNQQSR